MYSALISGDPLGRWARRVEDREAETFVPSSLPPPPPPCMLLHTSLFLFALACGYIKRRQRSYHVLFDGVFVRFV